MLTGASSSTSTPYKTGKTSVYIFFTLMHTYKSRRLLLNMQWVRNLPELESYLPEKYLLISNFFKIEISKTSCEIVGLRQFKNY